MISVLDRYIGRSILSTIMATLFMLVSLSGIIKFVDQLRKTGRGDYDALGALFYTALSIAKDIEIFFPMAALLGALLGLGALATHSELVAMESAGYTRLQIAKSVMKTALPLMLLTMAIGEWVAPKGEQIARNMRANMMYGTSLLSNKGNLWAKDGNSFIYIEHVVSDNNLAGINIYQFDKQQKLQTIRYAANGQFDDMTQKWQLSQVSESVLTDDRVITGSNKLLAEWDTTLTPDKLGVVVMNPEALSMSDLYRYISYLKASGQEAKNYQQLFWSKVFAPISVAVMMLMALSFVFGPLRSVTMGVRIVIGISCGFAFYVLDRIFGPLSQVVDFPPLLGALLPSLLFLVISVYLLRRQH